MFFVAAAGWHGSRTGCGVGCQQSVDPLAPCLCWVHVGLQPPVSHLTAFADGTEIEQDCVLAVAHVVLSQQGVLTAGVCCAAAVPCCLQGAGS